MLSGAGSAYGLGLDLDLAFLGEDAELHRGAAGLVADLRYLLLEVGAEGVEVHRRASRAAVAEALEERLDRVVRHRGAEQDALLDVEARASRSDHRPPWCHAPLLHGPQA